MDPLFDTFVVLLKKSLDLRFWAAQFLLLVAFMIGFLVSMVVVAIPFILAFAAFQLSPVGIFVYLLLIFLSVFLFTSWIVVYSGMWLFLGKHFLESGTIAFSESFKETQNRFWSVFKQFWLLFAVSSIIFLIVLFPLITTIASFLMAGNFSIPSISVALLSSVVWLFIGFFGLLLVWLAALPGLILLQPVIFFENIGAWQSIQRCIQLGKKNYWTNWSFYALLAVFSLVLNLPLSLISGAASLLPESNPVYWLLVSLHAILYLAILLWTVSVGSLFYPKLYSLNTKDENELAMKQLVQQTIEKHEFIVERHENALKQKK